MSFRPSGMMRGMVAAGIALAGGIGGVFGRGIEAAANWFSQPHIGQGWDIGGRNGGRRDVGKRKKHTSRVKSRKRTRCKMKRRAHKC